MHLKMQAANNAGSTWRKVFDELLVLEQDFDTAMQILINQDSKVAKLSLEDTHHTRSQHVHDAKVKEASIRCKRRGMSRKRRCSTRESIPRPKPPPIPSSHVSDTTRVVSDIQSNDFLNRLNADRMVGNPNSADDIVASLTEDAEITLYSIKICAESGKQVSVVNSDTNAIFKRMRVEGSDSSARSGDQFFVQRSANTSTEAADVDCVNLISNVASTEHCQAADLRLVTSLFWTGSGKQVSISKTKLNAYEKKMLNEDPNDLATSSNRLTEPFLHRVTDIAAEHAGANCANVVANAESTDNCQAADSELVTSLFCTGSGKQVSICKTKLNAYEKKLLREDPKDLADQSAATNVHRITENDAEHAGADGASRVSNVTGSNNCPTADLGLVMSLFRTGSGKQVSISKTKLNAYEKKKLNEEPNDLATSSNLLTEPFVHRVTDIAAEHAGANCANVVANAYSTDNCQAADSELVTSLFCTGSGKQVSICKTKLNAYEKKLLREDPKDLADQSAATNVHRITENDAEHAGADGASRVSNVTGSNNCPTADLGLVMSLFRTGSGKQVSISKTKLNAYEKKMLNEEPNDLATSSNLLTEPFVHRVTDIAAEHAGANCANVVANADSTDNCQAADSELVTSLFCTGSGKQVSICKTKLNAYEKKLLREDPKDLADQSAATNVHRITENDAEHSGADGASRVSNVTGFNHCPTADLGLVMSLFRTGSGKQVSISKTKLNAYEKKMLNEDRSDLATSSNLLTEPFVHRVTDIATEHAGANCANVVANADSTDNCQAADSELVTSLFCTGSGKQVSICKTKLNVYEKKLLKEDPKDLADQSATTNVNHITENGAEHAGADGASRISNVIGSNHCQTADLGLVMSLFRTGSGKQVSISKTKLNAYEKKMLNEDRSDLATSSNRLTEPFVQRVTDIAAGHAGANCGNVVANAESTDNCQAADSELVTSLFCTGSGKQVSICKTKLNAYEKKLLNEDLNDSAISSNQLANFSRQCDTGMQASGKAGCENSTANVVSAGHDEGANLGLVESTNSGSFQASPETYKKPVSNEGSSGGSDHNAMHVGARSGSGNCDRLVDSALPSTTNYNKSACNSKEVKLALTVGNGARSLANKSSTKGCDTRTAPTSKQCNCKDTKCSKEHIAALIVEMDGERKRVIQPQSHGNDVERVEETMLLPLKISPFAKRDTFEGWNINNRSVRQCSKINKLAALGCDNNTKYQEHDPSKQDKENMHPVNLIVLKTGTVEASRTSRSSTTLKQLNMNITQTQRGHQQRRVKTSSTYFMKPCFKLVRSRPFHPPTANKPLSASKYRSCHETGRSTTSRTKKQKITANEAKPFIYKKLLRISLAALTRLHDDPCVSSGVLKLPRFQVLRLITARNAHRVRFGQDGCLNCSLDEAYDTTTFLGPRELYRKLKAGNYILERMNATFEWFLNHYRWIVWKLAATERAFPRLLLSNYLTQDQVMKQITYRYQRDLNEAKRSILKKMLQREASATNCMVLCVAAVLPFSSDSVEAIDPELPAFWNMALVLTDGWYSVYAVPDAPLAAVLWKLHSKSHLVGTKLATWNATLHNSTEGIDPLECAIVRESEWRNPLLAKEDLTQWPYLQLRCNSTRRARFETRLGVENLHHLNLTESRRGEQQPHLLISLLKSIPLKSLEIGGGMVRSVRIRVTRISPILHLQSKEWTLGPRILCEEQLPLYFQLRSEYAQAVMQKAYTRNDEDSRVDNYLNGDQINVPLPIPFIKVDVECTHSSPEQGTGILTIWRPSDDLLSGGLREGAEYYVSSLTVNWKVDGGRGQNAFVRLSSTKHSGFEEINDHGSLLNNITRDETSRQNQHRVCLNVQQATMNYRNEFENKTNVRSDESRPKIDICVCVVLVTNRETQDVSRSMTPNKSDVSLLDPETKPHESRYVEYVFVTDHSRHLMSIRVTGMEVSMPTKSSNQKSKHSSPSSIHFRRGSKICWKEGAILCLSGLEVSHYDEQLRVLDCVLVESTQIVSFPSKKSSFWNNFQLLQREVGNDPVQGSTVQATFSEELDKLREYVKRAILQLNCISSQESHEHHIETAEQEKLTQELLAHEGDTTAAVEQKRFSDSSAFQMWWDVKVVRIIPLYGPTRPMFSRSVEFIAYVSVGSSGVSFRTLYLTQEVMLALQSLLKQAAVSEGTNGNTTKNITVLQNVQQMLCSHKKHHGDYTFCFEVHQVKNEWLVNSWRPWQRLHAEYWIATTVTASHLGS